MKAISGALTTMRNISLAVHLPLIGVIVPAIGSLIFNTFFELATYDTIEQVELNENTFKFSDEAQLGNPVPPQFEALGYETRNALLNLGTIAIVIFVYFFRIVVVLPILKLIKAYTSKDSWFHDLYDIEFKALFFQEIVLVATECYFEFILAACLGSKGQSWQYNGDVLSSMMVGLSFGITILLPFFFYWIYSQNVEYLRSNAFKDKWGSVLDKIDLDSKFYSKANLLTLIIYVFRRIIFMIICFKESLNITIRVILVVYMNLLIAIYTTQFSL